MPNQSQTALNDAFEAFSGNFDKGLDRGQRAVQTQSKAGPSTMASLLAKTLGVGRPDWRQARHARVNYASSRVRYVEEAMTADQVREFE